MGSGGYNVATKALDVMLLFHKIAMLRATMPVTIDWINELSAERYRPMLRLLDYGDFVFLRSQPGCTPALLVGLRRARVRVFRAYLRELTGDFTGTCAAIKLLIVQSVCERPELAASLVRSHVAFAVGMIAVHARLALFARGLGTVNVTNLVKLLDAT